MHHRGVVMHLCSRAAAVLALAGCASGAAGVPERAPTSQTVAVPRGGPIGGEDGLLTITRSNRSAVDSIATGVAPTLAALRRAYAALGLPVTLDEPATGRLGNARHVVSRSLNRTPLSEYIQCGSTLTGDRATNDRIYLSVVSTVRPLAGGSSSVATDVSATAVDMSGSAADPQPCTSTGVLENRLIGHVKTAAAAP